MSREWDKEYHPYLVNPESTGQKLAEIVREQMECRGDRLSPMVKFLGLGAGPGIAELAMAQELGISNDRVTLVNRTDRLADQEHSFRYVISGMYDFLDKHTETDYSVVSAIGIEIALGRRDHMEEFIKGVSRITTPHAYVCIYPYPTLDESIDQVWLHNNFEATKTIRGIAAPRVYTRK